MNHPTVICILFSLLFMSVAPGPAVDTSAVETGALTPQEMELRDYLWEELQADGLAASNQAVVIEFEFHDLFINEEIPGYAQMLKYQKMLRSFGVTSGPQRQIHLSSNGGLIIGDFNDWGEMLGEPVRIGLAVATNE
ncbi:MAG: hypothetical protein AAFZ63_05660 [Bacteroidota bacterium]